MALPMNSIRVVCDQARTGVVARHRRAMAGAVAQTTGQGRHLADPDRKIAGPRAYRAKAHQGHRRIAVRNQFDERKKRRRALCTRRLDFSVLALSSSR